MTRAEIPLNAPNMALLLTGSRGLQGGCCHRTSVWPLAARGPQYHPGNVGMDEGTNGGKDCFPAPYVRLSGCCLCPPGAAAQRIIQAWAPQSLIRERVQGSRRWRVGLVSLSPGPEVCSLGHLHCQYTIKRSEH